MLYSNIYVNMQIDVCFVDKKIGSARSFSYMLQEICLPGSLENAKYSRKFLEKKLKVASIKSRES